MTTLDRTKAPDFKHFQEFDIKEANSLTLNNSLVLHYINAGDQPVVRLELIFEAGVWNEAHAGQAYFTGQMLKEGTTNNDSQSISLFFDQYGAFLEINPGVDQLSVTVYGLTKHFPVLIPFVRELVFDSTFPEKELNTLKNIKIQNIKVQDEKNNVFASKIFRAALFGENHPYGKYLTEALINQIKPGNLLTFHKTRVIKGFQIILSGKVSDAEIRLIEENFGRIPLISVNQNSIKHTFSYEPKKKIVKKEDSLQSSIRMGKVLFPKKYPDYAKFTVVLEILGGYFGSRLMKNIREEKGYTYGIHAAMANFINAGYVVIGTDVKKSFTEATIEEIHHEIGVLQNTAVPHEELETVKNYMLGTFQASITTPFSLAEKFKAIYFYGLDYQFYHDYLASVKSVSQEDILQLSQKYLQIESLTQVVVGG